MSAIGWGGCQRRGIQQYPENPATSIPYYPQVFYISRPLDHGVSAKRGRFLSEVKKYSGLDSVKEAVNYGKQNMEFRQS